MPSGSMGRAGVIACAMSAAVRGHIRRQRLSDNILAARIGVSQNCLSKRLRDDAPPTLNDVEAICAALNVPVLDLVSETALLAASAGRPGTPAWGYFVALGFSPGSIQSIW